MKNDKGNEPKLRQLQLKGVDLEDEPCPATLFSPPIKFRIKTIIKKEKKNETQENEIRSGSPKTIKRNTCLQHFSHGHFDLFRCWNYTSKTNGSKYFKTIEQQCKGLLCLSFSILFSFLFTVSEKLKN